MLDIIMKIYKIHIDNIFVWYPTIPISITPIHQSLCHQRFGWQQDQFLSRELGDKSDLDQIS